MPTITFTDIQELITYVNQFIRTNHNNEITGEQHNNVEIGLTDFIISSPRNYNKAKVTSTAISFLATAAQCVLIFKSGATGTIELVDNKWNEWVIYNNSGAAKQLIGAIATYRTSAGIAKNYVAASQVLHLAKGEDNLWYEVDNGGGGSGGSGVSQISITSADFEADGVTILNSLLTEDNVSVYWNDLSNFIYKNIGQWEYVTSPSNGIKILIPGFDASQNDYFLELFLKEITT